jgi:hypothetical protein
MTSRLLLIALFSAAVLPRCVRVTDGIEVDVAYQPEATPAQIQTDMGYGVRLSRAMVALGKVELLRCDNFVLDLWSLVAPARARAHEFETPTSLGVPVVIDLVESAGTPMYAGTLRPPPGKYCGIRVLGMPADQDAEGLTDQTRDMMEHSVLVSGVIELSDGSQSDIRAGILDVLDCEMSFDRPLQLGGPVLESVAIEIDHRRWFDGIDFALDSESAVQERITENVRSSFRAILPSVEDQL